MTRILEFILLAVIVIPAFVGFTFCVILGAVAIMLQTVRSLSRMIRW